MLRTTNAERRLVSGSVIHGLLIGLFLPGFLCATDASEEAKILAEVAGRRITADQLRHEWRQQGAGSASESAEAERAASLLEEMVRFELLYAAASSSGYDRQPEILEAIRHLIVDRYLEDTLLPALATISIEEDEIETFYRDHAAELGQPAAVRGAVIQVTIPATSSEAKREQLRRRARAARDEALDLSSVVSFGSVAVEYSDDQATRYRGGEIGWLTEGGDPGRWHPAILDALEVLEDPGAISPVIETPSAYYLVKLLEARPGRVQTLEQVRQRIVHQLFQEKRQAVQEELFDRLTEQIDPEVFAGRLNSLLQLERSAGRQPPPNPET